ncbi:peptidyl-prolyl cis-trans isomerase B (cyclophilin B) [Desulfuromusa kysingii]|uniref:Peptidyl-prolyl cis-trans isomerase n=1 Tax=Desulfuromusa kysingii TaxID=37625 RepID=A0A1H3ZMQ7_9BACT|nr:peptidylprolyl isomerase [Desulfuromusa kysingii]SEA24937.1 peptidyl-prolyl cis-trans isomerase B (cyclophilin B) [Desulfuromusa kysingii]
MSTQPIVEMQTNKGLIIIELDAEKAPITTENFLSYVRDNFFDQTIFHRVIPNFMIQGGGFTPEMGQKKTKTEIKNEAHNGLKNLRGSIAMARTQVVDSASSQFFINLADNDFLNHQGKTPNGYGYAVFGQVIKGMDVVDEIAKVSTGNNGHHQDVPTEAIIIESVSIQEAAETK